MRFAALWLSGVIVVVYVLQQFFSTEPFLFIDSLKFTEPWRLITSIFAHGSPAHLLNNLFALILFGLVLEGRIGSRKVLWLFLVTGIAVNIISPYPRSLGASGAIYGILGVLIALRPMMVIWLQWMPMPMIVAGVVWLVQDIFGVFYPSNVANLAHISGLFLGVAAGFYWRRHGYGDKLTLPKPSKKDPVLERQLDDWEMRYMRK
jgi:membrane associated rhomboid family serine protease